MSQPPQPAPRPDPDVNERPRHRTFSAEYKAAILEEADQCTEPGQIGKLLRREGLYSSHLTDWRRKRDEGGVDALRDHPRGRPGPIDAQREILRLENALAQAHEKLRQAELIIDTQKKVTALLGDGLTTLLSDAR